jgi:outer membrane lipase/esterase
MFSQWLAAWRQVGLAVPQGRLNGAALLVACVAAGALSACGGGEQAAKFSPAKVVSFGDESSVLTAVAVAGAASGPAYVHGQKYTVNEVSLLALPTAPSGGRVTAANQSANEAAWGAYPAASGGSVSVSVSTSSIVDIVDKAYAAALSLIYTDASNNTQTTTTGTANFLYTYDCYTYNKLWIQVLASGYGKGYATGGTAEPVGGCPHDRNSGAVTYAEPRARVSGLPAGKSVKDQVAAHRGELDSNTLVTMLAGQNDIIAAYQAAVGGTVGDRAAAQTSMEFKGRELGAIINDIAATGARVVFLTVPDLSKSPLARAGDPAFMASLVARFNRGLTGLYGVKNDGRKFALVNAALETTRMADSPASYGLSNATQAWCTSGRKPDGTLVTNADPDFVLYCNSLTGATATGGEVLYMWADDTHLGPAVHASLGGLAYNRATANPF